MSAEDFIRHVIVDGLQARHLMVGDDFCYGARRAGDVAMLQEAGREYGFHVETLPTVMNGSTRISSSAVRLALAAVEEEQYQPGVHAIGRTFKQRILEA